VHDNVQVQNAFERFQTVFKKSYSSVNEKAKRLEVFSQNLKEIVARNAARQSDADATFGITKFTDMTNAEFKAKILIKEPIKVDMEKVKQQKLSPKAVHKPSNALPATFDWRSKKCVTPVKDQGQCGSCWAFSTIENVESVWILSGKANVSTLRLAPQQLVDCSDLNMGCNGGNPPDAYESIYFEGGIETEDEYPYTGEDDSCMLTNGQASAGSVQIATWKLVSSFFDESSMQSGLVSVAPLSVCVDASNWQNYQSGVMTASQCAWINQLDHCVQLVGYNTTTTTPYWIVRNSWNSDWGIDGYIWLQMSYATCGIGYEVTSAVLK